MRYGKGKLERKESLVDGEREKKEKMEMQGSLGFIFIKLLVPYKPRSDKL